MTAMTEQVRLTMENLKKHRYDVKFVETKEEVPPIIREMIPEGALVGSGGSISLAECGVMDLLRSGRYQYLDRFGPDITPEEREMIGHKAHSRITSSAAATPSSKTAACIMWMGIPTGSPVSCTARKR